MKETQKRIMEYNFKLPKLKEKVIAVALLLAVSASMLITVSFAWLSISINPAVQGVNTTVAANGNLEIALATGSAATITAPGESKVGDSNLPILERNLTWGNLVNLADASYGLSQMTLRPAKLNEFALATNPLHGPVYDEDGRVAKLDTSFGYATWNSEFNTFEQTDKLGVRAITSMIEGEAGEASAYRSSLYDINGKNGLLQDKYKKLADDEEHMNALTDVMVGYMLHAFRTGGSSVAGVVSEASFSRTQLQHFKALYEDFADILAEQAQVYADFLNLQAKIEGKSISITAEEILSLSYGSNAAATAVKNKGFTAVSGGFINELDTYLSDYYTVVSDIDNIQGIIDAMTRTSVSWPDAKYTNSDNVTVSLEDIVNRFAILRTCTVYLPVASETIPVSSFTSAKAVMKLTSEETIVITVTNGLLKNFENRNGARLKAEEVPLQMSAAGYNVNVLATVVTDATTNLYDVESANLLATIASKYGTPRLVPNEAYGLAIDFWVRTNASGGYLTLQGNVLTEKEEVEVTGIDKNGNTVNIYSLSREITQEVAGENSETTTQTYTQDYDLYWLEEEVDGETQKVWYNASTHVEFVLEEGENPRQKIETVETVIGYEGDNRVWEGDEHAILSVNSTTQGSGSCYVYYADTPEDQARSLELLKYMKVAFIDAEGNLLAEAYMDTERHYAANGKVTVPMVLENNSDSINLGTDDDGNPIIAITALEKNTPMLVTALVYLDGYNLKNNHVLASSEIAGQLNIQFGNNQLLKPIDNEELYYSEMNISASLTNTEFNYDDNTEMKTTVEVVIDGVEPQTVEAFFIRAINSQTGAKEKTFTLNDDDGDGVWTADYEFLYPGTYVLRSVTIDGIERELTLAEGESFPTVTVKGFEINNVNYNINPTVLSVDNSYTGDVSLQFTTDDPDRMPKTVTGKFIREDGTTVNVNFAYDPTTQIWKGNATFVSSGEYTMQYIVLDGVYTELDEGNRFTTNVKLGVKVDVSTNTQTNFVMDVDGNYPKKLDMMVVILDNNDNRITGFTDAKLYYSLRGGSATNRLYAPLTWDAENDCFAGTFETTSGIWNFSYVEIKYGDSVSRLSTANSDAPVFTIIAPDPPEEHDGSSPEGVRYQYKAGTTNQNLYSPNLQSVNGAKASVVLKYATAAQVYAQFEKLNAKGEGTGEFVYVYGVSFVDEREDNLNRFEFAVPEGEWKLVGVRAWNVYDSNQVLYSWGSETEVTPFIDAEQYETGLPISIYTDTDTYVTVAALYNVEIEFGYTNTKNTENYYIDENNKKVIFGMGKDGKEIVSDFMASHIIAAGDIIITFKDDNNLIENGRFKISDVQLFIDYAAQANEIKKYGGYTTTTDVSGNVTVQDFEVSGGNVASLKNDVTLQYAAQYEMGDLYYSIVAADNTKTGPISVDGKALDTAYLYEVWSKAPTVTISAISPSGSNPAKITYTTRDLSWRGTEPTFTATGNQTSTRSDYQATVYAKAAADNSTQRHGTFTQPTITLNVSGVGSSDSVTIVLPAGSKCDAVTFTRTGNGTITKSLGKVSQIKSWTSNFILTHTLQAYYGHGEHTIDTCEVTHNGVTYTIHLETSLVIKNYDSVNQ